MENPWLAASPDGLVTDPSDATRPLGLIEIKIRTRYEVKLLLKHVRSHHSVWRTKMKNDSFKLKTRHDYYYQVQAHVQEDAGVILY